MPKDGSILSIDTNRLLTSLFTLLPIPVAVIDDRDHVVLANSCFNDIFRGVDSISEPCIHEIIALGRGTFDLEILPLNDDGFRIVYGIDVSKEVCLRRQLTQIEAFGRGRGKDKTAHVPCDLNEIVRSVARAREPLMRSERIILSLDLDAKLPLVEADPKGIGRVLTALVENAEQAIISEGRRYGSVQIRTWPQASGARLSVGDNAVGVIARRLCAPEGEQWVEGSHSIHPTSVGWCAEMIRDYGGSLFCWTSYAVGSMYTLELPATAVALSPQRRSDF